MDPSSNKVEDKKINTETNVKSGGIFSSFSSIKILAGIVLSIAFLAVAIYFFIRIRNLEKGYSMWTFFNVMLILALVVIAIPVILLGLL